MSEPKRKDSYGFHRMDQQGRNPSGTRFERTSHLRSTARFAEEANLVGIEDPRNELIQWLESRELTLTATAVLGMVGLGKTTFAGKVYDSKEVKANFESHAGITVSQSFIIEDNFRRMVKDFCGSWESVAMELQNHAASPLLLTPQNCRQKYLDLQHRFTPVVDGTKKDGRRVERLPRL